MTQICVVFSHHMSTEMQSFFIQVLVTEQGGERQIPYPQSHLIIQIQALETWHGLGELCQLCDCLH